MFGHVSLPDHGPVFLNEGTSIAELELQKLGALQRIVSETDRKRLSQDIRFVRAGIAGERKIIFELKNSHYPLVFIHDLQLEHEGLNTQVDFLVVTPYNLIVIECKNLVGDIEIDSSGAFTRTVRYGRRVQREGIYSPVTQNLRHVEMLKAIRRSESGRVLRHIQQYMQDDFYHSVVVLANENTILSADDASPEIRQQVIRADQLVQWIKDKDCEYARKNGKESFEWMMRIANRWLARNTPTKVDFAGKYELDSPKSTRAAAEPTLQKRAHTQNRASFSDAAQAASARVTQERPAQTQPGVPVCPLCGAPMVLRVARYGKNKGNRFWGCSKYATTCCRGIVEYEG